MSNEPVNLTKMYRAARSSDPDVLYNEILGMAADQANKRDLLRYSIDRVDKPESEQPGLMNKLYELVSSVFDWLAQPAAATSAFALLAVVFISSNFIQRGQSLTPMYEVALLTSLDDLEVSQMNTQKDLSPINIARNSKLAKVYLGQELANKVVASGQVTSLISQLNDEDLNSEIQALLEEIREIESAALPDRKAMVITLLESDDLLFSGYWLTLFKAGLLRIDSFSPDTFFAHSSKVKKSLSQVLSKEDLEQVEQTYKANNSIEAWYSYSEFLSKRLGLQ